METALPGNAGSFRNALVSWFRRNANDYPWRRTRDPYAILVSEVMLQQTRISVVLGRGYFSRFLVRFPDVRTLAVADDTALLKTWEGMGYYRRARMLRDSARAIVERHSGEFPTDLKALLALPGIGKYTAGAVRAFAFGLPAVLVDGNVARVLARLMDDPEPVDSPTGSRKQWQLAALLADEERPREYHAALMELGQRICKSGTPLCTECPIAVFCTAERPESLPVKSTKKLVTEITETAVWSRDAHGRLLLACQQDGRRHGLWRLPLRELGEISPAEKIAEETYSITRYRVRLAVFRWSEVSPAEFLSPREGEIWCDEETIAHLPLAAPFRRVVERILAAEANRV